MDLGLRAVSNGLLVARGRGSRVRLDLDVEHARVIGLGRAERADDDRDLERLGGHEELDGDVLLGLQSTACQQPGESRRSWLLTICTTAFPESLVVRGNGASSPESLSLSTTNSWCGRFPLPLSFAVRATLRASVLPREIGFESGVFALSLWAAVSRGLLRCSQSCQVGPTSP